MSPSAFCALPPTTERPGAERPLLVHHVARMCGISRRTVRWAAAKGLLKGFRDEKTPKLWRFQRQDVVAYRNSRAAARHTRRSRGVGRAA